VQIDALYFSVTTVSTVGLGDLSPQTDIGKLFTVVYIFVGVAADRDGYCVRTL
jgi:hypothetical protein